LEWTGTDDIEYLRNKMMAALKIPKAFLGYDESLSGKATLAAEDIRFARTIQRVQRIIVSELNKIAVIHLYAQGYRDESLVDFSLELTNPSTIFEKEKIEVWKSKVDLCKDMQENKMFSKKWMYEHVFNVSDHDVIELQKQLVDDSKSAYRLKQIEEEGNDPALPFLKSKEDKGDEGGGEGGGGAEGGTEGGLSDLGLETPEAEPAGGGAAGGAGETPGSQPAPSAPATPAEAPAGGKLTEKSRDRREYDRERERTRERDRDQTGRKKKYIRGEDPLGSLENNRKPDLSVTHKYKNNSPLSYESLQGLSSLLGSYENDKGLLKEDEQKSFMDESNIRE
jgi:hypothetical protein